MKLVWQLRPGTTSHDPGGAAAYRLCAQQGLLRAQAPRRLYQAPYGAEPCSGTALGNAAMVSSAGTCCVQVGNHELMLCAPSASGNCSNNNFQHH